MFIPIKSIIIIGFQVITGTFVFLGIAIPLVRGVKRMIKGKGLETDIRDVKIGFSFFYSAIISITLLLIIQNPQDLIVALLTGLGLTVTLSFFLLITMAQRRMFKGGGNLDNLYKIVTRKRKK